MGWRVAVYWRTDAALYPGNIIAYDASSGKHEVEYDDGESEWLALNAEVLVWRLPPGLQVIAAALR